MCFLFVFSKRPLLWCCFQGTLCSFKNHFSSHLVNIVHYSIRRLFWFFFLLTYCRNYQQALNLMRRATAMPSTKTDYYDEVSGFKHISLQFVCKTKTDQFLFMIFQSETVQKRVYKSLKLWSMYADLEESLGTFQVTTATFFICKSYFRQS